MTFIMFHCVSPRFADFELLPMPAGENQPAIESLRAALAATTRPNAKRGREPLDDIAKAYVFLSDKSGQAHLVGSVFGVLSVPVLVAFLRHVTS